VARYALPCGGRRRSRAQRAPRREHFRAFAGELPDESELDTYRGFCITGRRDTVSLSAALACPSSRAHPCSHHDAYDETRVWINDLCEFLRVRSTAVQAPLSTAARVDAALTRERTQMAVRRGGVKILGGCFGCQAR
jgi:hypothetical protein